MRIRTDEKPHRERTIEQIAEHYGCNKTRALMLAADQVVEFHIAINDILEIDSLSIQQRQEIAERVSRCRGLDVQVNAEVDVDLD